MSEKIDIEQVDGIGALESLTTTDKTNLVNAINEVNGNSSKRISTIINQGNNWYRIARGTVSGGVGCSFILIIERNYGYTNNESYTFSINTAFNGKTTITQLSGTYNTRILTKIRVVNTNSGGVDVDVFYNHSLNNTLSVRVIGSGKAVSATIAPEETIGVTELETTLGIKTVDSIFANNRVRSVNGFEISGRTNSDIVLAGGGYRPVNDFALANEIITPNNGLLTISTSSDLTGGGTFSADQATASNVDIGLSSGTLSSLALADSALQSGDDISELNNDVGFITEADLPTVGNGNITYSGVGDITGGGTSTANQTENTDYTFDLTSQAKNNIALGVTAHGWGDFRDYGLGTNAVIKTGSYNDISENAFIYGPNLTDGPVGTGIAQMGLHIQSDSTRKFQIISRTSGSGLYFRNSHTNGWSDWFQLYHTGNFNPAQYVLQSNLNTQLGNYATLAGVNTFTNTNTFLESPYIPAGTLDGHAVNLGQLNTAIASVTYTLPTASATVLGGIKVGNNLTIDANGVLSATDTNTTYSAGTGLTLSGTTFGQTITTNGYGSVVTGITQTSNGFQVNYGNLGINTEVKVYYHGEINNGDTIFCTASKTIMYLSPMFSGPLHIEIEPELMNGSELIIIHNYTGSGPGFFNLVGNFIDLTGQEVSSFLASQGKYMRLIYVKDVGRFAFVDGGQV